MGKPKYKYTTIQKHESGWAIYKKGDSAAILANLTYKELPGYREIVEEDCETAAKQREHVSRLAKQDR